MKLYNYFRSSASFRVRIALHLKNLAFDYMPVHLARGDHKKDDYAAISPDMLSLLGCSVEEMTGVLKALGFRSEGAKSETGADILLWRPRRRHETERQAP